MSVFPVPAQPPPTLIVICRNRLEVSAWMLRLCVVVTERQGKYMYNFVNEKVIGVIFRNSIRQY